MKKFSNKKTKIKMPLPFIDKLTLFLAPAGIAILVLLIIFSFQQYEKKQVTFTQDVISEMAYNQEMQIDSFINGKMSSLRALSSFPEIYEMNPDVFSDFIKEKMTVFGFSDVFIMDLEGTGYYPNEGTVCEQSDTPFFHTLSQKETFVTDPFYTEYGPITTICQAIYNNKYERVGTICGKVTLSTIQDLVNQNETLLDGQCFVVNSTGSYLSSSRITDLYSDTSVFANKDNDLSLVIDAFNCKSNEQGRITYEGVKCFSSVKYMKNYNWCIVICVPEENLYQNLESILALQYVLIGFIILFFIVIIHIISLWKKSDTEINTDSLCRCGSRAACFRTYEKLKKDHKNDITLIYSDLNNFKYVNDNYGHDTGDELLKLYADVLMRTFFKHGFVGRMGGDEFVVILKNVSDEQTQNLINQVALQLKEESKKLPFEYNISFAYGFVTKKSGDSDSILEYLNKADNLMYKNKKSDKS